MLAWHVKYEVFCICNTWTRPRCHMIHDSYTCPNCALEMAPSFFKSEIHVLLDCSQSTEVELLISQPTIIIIIIQCSPFFLVQSSFLGSAVQTTPSSNTLWKTNSLGMESISRQRSSSDPPTVHPPVPPLRVTSTSMFALSAAFLVFAASNHGWPWLSIPQFILILLSLWWT